MITTIVGTILGAGVKIGEKYIDYKNAKLQLEVEQQRFSHERILKDQDYKHARLMKQSDHEFEETMQDKQAYLDLELSADDLLTSAINSEAKLEKGDWRGFIRPTLTGILLFGSLYTGHDYLQNPDSVMDKAQFDLLLAMVLEMTGFALGFWFGAKGASKIGNKA